MSKSNQQAGFLLPSILLISTALLVIGLAISQLVIVNNQAITRSMYEQIAQTAAKSGVDYAKEQFISTGTYSGTSEQTIIQNGNYRATFSVAVLATSPDGLEKKIESIGKIYIPEQNTSQLLLSSIKSELIRTTAVAITPGEFSPLAWYDASDNPTVHQIASTTANWTHLNTNNNYYLNERTSNGTQTNGSWNNTWISFGYNSVLGGEAYAGALFSLSGIPAGATINNAHMQFQTQGTTLAVSSVEIRGLAMSAIEPQGTFAAPPTANQLRNQPTIGPAIQWGILQWPVGGQYGPAQQTPDLKDIVQATLSQPGFNPATHHIGFRVERLFGIGNHRVTKGRASLVVNYTVAASTPAGDGDKVTTWDDKSGNGRHLRASSGQEPTYRTNQQNGLAMVQFPAGGNAKLMQTDLFNLAEKASAGTIFAVAKADSASASDATMVRMDGPIPAEANCIGGDSCTSRSYNLSRVGSSSSLAFAVQRSGTGGTTGQSVSLPGLFVGNPPATAIAGGVAFAPGSCNPNLDIAAVDIASNNDYASNCPNGVANPKSFQNDLRISVGKNVASSLFAGHLGEVVIYDKQLSCQQVQSIQKYLRQKWFNDSSDSNIITCPALSIPSF